MLAVIVCAVALRLGMKGEFHFDSPRFWYFTYLVGLILLAIACTLPRMTIALLSLATLEIGLGRPLQTAASPRPIRCSRAIT